MSKSSKSAWSELGKIMKQVSEAEDKEFAKLEKDLAPQRNALKEMEWKIDRAFKKIYKVGKPLREFLDSISAQKRQWLSDAHSASTESQEDWNLFKIVDGEIIFRLEYTKYRKAKSVHRLLLMALLTLPSTEDVTLYSDIEEYFVKNGLKAANDSRKSRKRILDAKKDLFRLLSIPRIHREVELIEVVPGQGLRLHNSKT